MPPKKQEEEPAGPYLVWNVLPVLCGAPNALDALRKPANIKKTLELPKIIEILKQKGIEKYLAEGQLSEEGYHFACQNLQQAAAEFITQLRKPADPKKDQKKDTKKDSKKEEVPVEEPEKPIEFTFEKAVNEFIVFLDLPKDPKTLKTAVESGWKIDAVVWIEEMVKESSRLPNYDLLNKERTIDDFLNEINNTAPKPQEQHSSNVSKAEKDSRAEFLAELKRLRTSKVGDLEQTIIVEVPYFRDLQHPENDTGEFLGSFLKRLCELSLSRVRFEQWKKEQTVGEMVETIKEKVRREVVVEEKKEEKKGGKKEPTQPQTEIIEQIVEKRYEDMPGNAKSALTVFTSIAKLRKPNPLNVYSSILDNLALSVSEQTEKTLQVEPTNMLEFGTSFLQSQKRNPANRITVESIASRMPSIRTDVEGSYLRHTPKLKPSVKIENEISLAALLRHSPMNKPLEFEYKLELFERTMQSLETKLAYTFDDRTYAEKLDAEALSSRINLELELQPRVYLAESTADQFQMLVLARVNPPGRVFYENAVFDWKVLPNFEFWEKCFRDKQGGAYWNYDWRKAGNLKLLTKRLMPTDNLIITESLFVAGDTQHKIINLHKNDTFYELKAADGQNVFSKETDDLRLEAFTRPGDGQEGKRVSLAVRKQQFTVVFDETPTVFWSDHAVQEKRLFGSSGEVIKYLKDGSVSILYPNGDFSSCEFGEWRRIRSNRLEGSGPERQLKLASRSEGDKRIVVREDETVFVSYPNGDQLVQFTDGTTFTRLAASNTLEIANPCGLVLRKIFGRSKDLNVIGTGSAFAFLGETNILERSFDGGLLELHHPCFTWHSYTECVDRDGVITREPVEMMTFRDGAMLKVSHAGLLTFLHGEETEEQEALHERWLQLFTNPEYHGEGVYDVDLLQGWVATKDRESNIFKLSLEGESDVRIAVSFNIGSSAQEHNNYGSGYHVPEENYFLPHPHNHVTPRLFLINPDGTGEEFLTEEQVGRLKGFQRNRVSAGTNSFTQLIKQNQPPAEYYASRFTRPVSLAAFELPSALREETTRVNLIPARFPDIIFRNLQEMAWDRQYKALREVSEQVKQQRAARTQELDRLRKKD